MGEDDDIAASLPRPPLPAPARREAAVAEALRRFDGAGARPVQAAGNRRPARPSPWRLVPARPYAGALAGAFLVALIGLPFAWTSFDRYLDGEGERRTGVEATRSQPGMADADLSAADLAHQRPDAASEPSAAADQAPEGAAPEPAQAASAPPARDPAEAPLGGSDEPAAQSEADGSGPIVVTGTRIRNPNLASASPITVVGEQNVTGTRSADAGPRRRGDWNACTIEDPGRDLRACRNPARRAPGGAAAQVAEGVERAWEGDLDKAIAAFDRAIAIEPRSASAHLNRGLAWRQLGDLDRALADLDRAVRFAPRSARGFFSRSLLHRQRGDLKRARADEARAVELDPRYAAVVGTDR